MLPEYFEFFAPVKIVSGKKAVENLPYELDQLQAKRPFIVTDKGIEQAGLIDIIRKAMDAGEMEIGAVFDGTPPDSSIAVVNEAAKIYKDNNCDSIVAVGGGSVIDTAKGINIVITEGVDDISKLMGAEVLKKPMKPFIVIPTTAGTGSEVTLVAMISNPEEDVKMPFTSYRLFPNAAIIDPRMTMTMPPKITAATGMDALTHAIEAYYCNQKNPFSDAYAITAIKMISQYLARAVKNGKDEEARYVMANAATIAGIAFSNSMVGAIHSLGHATGGVAHVPHGVAMSIFLPVGLEYNIPKSGKYIGELLLYFAGPEEYAKTREDQRPYRLIELINKLREELHELSGLPLTLKEAGVKEDQFEEIAEHTLNDGALMFNPRDLNKEEALELVKKAYYGK